MTLCRGSPVFFVAREQGTREGLRHNETYESKSCYNGKMAERPARACNTGWIGPVRKPYHVEKAGATREGLQLDGIFSFGIPHSSLTGRCDP